MKVHNKCTYPIIAFVFRIRVGFGDDVVIPAGESRDVRGPFLGEMGGGNCFVHLDGEITCHEGQDDDNGFQVIRGAPLNLMDFANDDNNGVTVRHYLDKPEQHVMEW